MRHSFEIRARIQSDLTGMLLHPPMYGLNRAYELMVRGRLADLAFVDAAEEQLEQCWTGLEKDGYRGALGMYGAFASALPSHDDYTDRLASVHARIASALGYFEPARRVTSTEWEQFQRDVVSWSAAAPRNRADILARFGEPAYSSKSQAPRVLGYAGPKDDSWLFFDLEFVENHGGYYLRYLRLPIRPLRSSLVDVACPSRRFSLPDEEDSPECVYRRFLIATLSADEGALRTLVLPDQDNSILWEKAYPQDVAELLAEQYRTMDVVRVPAPPQPTRVYLSSPGCPVPLALVRTDAGWKVEARPLSHVRKEEFKNATYV